jgi:hypothetical protein
MEADPFCASSSRASKRTDVSTAVTIASITKVVVAGGTDGEMTTAAPSLERIRLRPLPSDEHFPFGLHLQSLAGLQAKQLTSFTGQDKHSIRLHCGGQFSDSRNPVTPSRQMNSVGRIASQKSLPSIESPVSWEVGR